MISFEFSEKINKNGDQKDQIIHISEITETEFSILALIRSAIDADKSTTQY